MVPLECDDLSPLSFSTGDRRRRRGCAAGECETGARLVFVSEDCPAHQYNSVNLVHPLHQPRLQKPLAKRETLRQDTYVHNMSENGQKWNARGDGDFAAEAHFPASASRPRTWKMGEISRIFLGSLFFFILCNSKHLRRKKGKRPWHRLKIDGFRPN
jgi:hypothetical protein